MITDLHRVGPTKPLSYVPIPTLEDQGYVVDVLERELKSVGKCTLLLSEEESDVSGGALYAYDEAALGALLNAHADLLKSVDWPVSPEAFVRKLKVTVPPKTKLFDLVADAFADTTNPGRSTTL